MEHKQEEKEYKVCIVRSSGIDWPWALTRVNVGEPEDRVHKKVQQDERESCWAHE